MEEIRNWVETPSLSNNFILSLKFYRTKEEERRGVPIGRCTSGQLSSIGKDRAKT